MTETKLARAEDIGRGVMRGSRATMKTGWTYDNACLAISEGYGLTGTDAVGLSERQKLLSYLFGFAVGMHVLNNDESDEYRHEGRRQGVLAFGRQYLEAFDRGVQDGLKEDSALIQPADLRHP